MKGYTYELINEEVGLNQNFIVLAKNKKAANSIMEVNKHLLQMVLNGYQLQIN